MNFETESQMHFLKSYKSPAKKLIWDRGGQKAPSFYIAVNESLSLLARVKNQRLKLLRPKPRAFSSAKHSLADDYNNSLEDPKVLKYKIFQKSIKVE